MENVILESLPEAAPFIRHMGVVPTVAKPSQGKARLEQRKEVENHISTIHAAALFGLAETSAGALVASLFFSQITALKIVARSGGITYLKPAAGEIEATAELELEPGTILKALDQRGNVEFAANVWLTDESKLEVGLAKFIFNVKFVA